MKDFWLSCGHHLLDRDADGKFVVTDEFIKAYLARPEVVPPPEACTVERTLHAALLGEPRRRVANAEIASIADPDARENWTLLLALRDLLLEYGTIEATYVALARSGFGTTPPLFVDQLVQLILRNALDQCEEPEMLRAAELFFRPQRLTIHHGSLIAADEETVAGTHGQPASPLVSMLGLPATAGIDVLNADNAASYWARSDRFDMALDLTAGRSGLMALGEVITCWIRHLLAETSEIEALVEATDVVLPWYVGLDAEATRIGDALWRGESLGETARSRLVGLYRLRLHGPNGTGKIAQSNPIYLIMAMTPDGTLRMKPQNLLTGLPARRTGAVS